VIVQQGPPQEVYRRPADLWVANFVGRANVLTGRAAGRWVETALGVLDLLQPVERPADTRPLEGAVDVVIRPEQLHVAAGAGTATVEDRRYSGTTWWWRRACRPTTGCWSGCPAPTPWQWGPP
jgi:ABC-type Fe3+/spermidine/putrescine transport system ATPase subunit